jgi:ATP-dependent Lhr-like helicase
MLLIEHYNDEHRNYYIFHSLYGRRVNDALSRTFAYIASHLLNRDVDLNVNDNGFYLSSEKKIIISETIKIIKKSNLIEILKLAVDKSEIMNRRFRHCAMRSLMILRTYMGKTKRVGRQQMNSLLLMSALKRISTDFPILKEARREVLEDFMDIKNAEHIIELIRTEKLKILEISTKIPSPFAFNLMVSSYTDIIKVEDKTEFLKRMHQMVLAKIALDKGKKDDP